MFNASKTGNCFHTGEMKAGLQKIWLYISALKVEVTCCPQSFATTYQTAQCYNPEVCSPIAIIIIIID